ncbi:BON domain-containing protein [Granulicella sp. S190]|uniref:BON domain-containing protein n=1 Tax=Granulicella sp. S190 TaxID=1747226 RepID=UPI00131B29B9|nr:BON domain-containing protein [Granulicella sp. S190]
MSLECPGRPFSKLAMATVLMASLALEGGVALAQSKQGTVPDAQIEASVLKALAGAPELADQAITSTTVYGIVTLSGTVRDEPLRDLADHLVSNTAGVQKVVDQLTIGAVPAVANSNPSQQDPSQGTNPNLQSDGSIAPPQAQSPPVPSNSSAQPAGQYPPPYQGQPQQGQYPPPYQGQQGGQYPPAYGASQQGGQYPPQGQYPAYGQSYPPQYPPQQPYVAQRGGDAVVVPLGANLRVRINQGMNSKHTVVGTTFDGVVLNDVVAGGAIAIPRGASIQGTVVAVHTAGELKGKGELKLQLNSVSLGGKVYPIATDFWWHQGADKTGNTVGNTVGLGAVGALIGAVAGGGVGAAVGAGVGGIAGLGVSAASGRGEAELPPEAIVVFHLTQPADITTVSQAELNRLGAGVPVGADPQFRRRYPPPPPPGYYGPAYYRPY